MAYKAKVDRDKMGRFIKGHKKPKEWIEKNRKDFIGSGNPFYGKKHNEETKRIIREKRALQDMSWRLGKFKHSLEAIRKISTNRRGKAAGENCRFWKGGITPENKRIRHSPEYRDWRIAVMKRDDYTCQTCLVRGGELNVDHIKPFSLFKENRFDLGNGRVLCVSCHRKTDTYGSLIYYGVQKQGVSVQ